MDPSDLREWVAEMRELHVAHLRTPEGLEITLAPLPEVYANGPTPEAEAPPRVREPFDDPFLNVPRLRREG